jgi:hypothetical protein
MRWVVPSALLGPKVGQGWPRGHPRSMGRPRSHPWGLGVAFGLDLNGSRAGPMATPGSARPTPGSGVGLNLGVAFGPTFLSGSTPTPTPPAGPLVATPVVVAGWVG